MILLLPALAACGSTAVDDSTPEIVIRRIREHFETVPSEFDRYKGITIYGETLSGTAPSKAEIAREIGLFREAVKAGLLKAPPNEVLRLGHNLIDHDPRSGEEFLELLYESLTAIDEGQREAVAIATLAAGERGENLVVAKMFSGDKGDRVFCAGYLQQNALYSSSIPPILKLLRTESDPSILGSLLTSLSLIGSPTCLDDLKFHVEHASNDDVQAAALFSYVELAGFDAIEFVEKVRTVGPKSAMEKKEGLDWLKRETSRKSKHGREVSNDLAFVERFGDLGSPALRWLRMGGLLEEKVLKDPPRLDPAKKIELLNLLIDSKGFGLEAVKASLFRSITREDEPSLLRLRAVSVYSPNSLSRGRLKTIGILIRHLRQL